MHSKIFQVSREPIERVDYISEDRYFDGFVGSIADYVSDDLTDEQRDNYITSLVESLGDAIEYCAAKDSFKVVNKKAFFDRRFDAWKKRLDILSKVTPEQFAGLEDIKQDQSGLPYDCSVGRLNYECSELYSDKFSYYIDDDGEYYGNQPLDSFMRSINNGDEFYFGAVIDYHM